MNTVAAARAMPAEAVRREQVFTRRYGALDDQQLLAHFQAPRGVSFFPVADAEETRAEKIEAIMAGHFEFNGQSFHLPTPIAWTVNPSDDVEWHILLHKFYYAVGLGMAFERSADQRYVDRWMELTRGWMEQTPLGFIAADVTGRRVQNWIYAYYHFVAAGRTTARVDPAFHRAFLESLHAQVEFLCANLTPARNHRTLELYAIFLAGVVFPEMTAAQRWRRFALDELVRNMQTDLLPDGVQCELSTDYHHLVLKNYLNVRRLASLNDIAVPAAMDESLQRALHFSLHAHKPDGIVPSLSDGDARGYAELLLQGYELFGGEDLLYVATAGREGKPPAQRSCVFADSGYVILRGPWQTPGERYQDAHYLIFDCGPLGAGNHGHFDCLSFELAALGHSLVVDPGRYTYSEAGDINWRIRFRGTAYHNTVTVDGRNQTRYLPKAVKEVSRHAHGSVRHKVSGPAPDAVLQAFHSGDGFDFVHGVAHSHEYDSVHERRILFVGGAYWLVSDWLHGEQSHCFDLRFHLSERAQGRVAAAGMGTPGFVTPDLLVAPAAGGDLESVVEDGYVSYLYGEKFPAPVLRFTRQGRCAAFHTVLYPYREDAPRVQVRAVAVDGEDGVTSGDAAHALVIEIDDNGRRHTDYVLFNSDGTLRRWPLAGVQFAGSFLFLRRDACGRIVRVHHGADATLSYLD